MANDAKLRSIVQWVGLLSGPPLAVVCFLLLPREYTVVGNAPDGDKIIAFTAAGRATLSIMVWMATWWLTEAIHISATALLPLVLFPIAGVATLNAAAAPYADPLIFLFFGGFVLALSMQRWGLDKRIALMTLSFVGAQPLRMIAGFMLVTAVLSAFVSNTATAAMMLPIALSVIALASGERKPTDAEDTASTEADNFATCLLLGIAYAASIGGVATIIGTPPNAILVGYLRDKIAEPYRTDISMAAWLMIGAPLAVAFLPIVLALLTKVLYPIRDFQIAGAKEMIAKQLRQLGRTGHGEWVTLIVFTCTAALWIARPALMKLEENINIGFHPFMQLKDAGIAMVAAVALFVIPVNVKQREFAMDWKTAQRLPWGILVLFGGGLSLAAAVTSTGAAEFLGHQARYFAGMPTIVIVLVVCAGVIFLTELTSNTATTAALVPVLAALAPGLGLHPYWLIFPATFAASFAFMLPVATPPNAIIFGSERITIAQMAKAGLWLNLIGIVLVTLLTMLLIGPILGIERVH